MRSDKFIPIRYTNAISTRLPNRRITVGKIEDGFAIELVIADDSPKEARAICRCLKGKAAITFLKVGTEAAYVMVSSLAELMGYELKKKEDNG